MLYFIYKYKYYNIIKNNMGFLSKNNNCNSEIENFLHCKIKLLFK